MAVPPERDERAGEAFLAINEAALALHGYSREELLRMTVADVGPCG